MAWFGFYCEGLGVAIFFVSLYNCAMIFSYIDPGTGSLLGSVIVGLSLALLFYLRGLFYRLVSVITGKRNACSSDFAGQLVFFSEGRNYWPVFQPICQELLQQGQSFVYLTAGQDDPGLKWLNQPTQAQAIYLGKLNSAIYSMNRLKAKMCVMTTPQLGIMQLKRSPHTEHYCHVMHSPTDVHTYEKFAFDHFDSVLCSSQYVMDNLALLEQKRTTDYMRKKGLVHERKLLATGCPYYQNYFAKEGQGNKGNAPQTKDLEQQPCILLASSWGERSFLNQVETIIEQVLALSYHVIFRPHPQAWVSNKEELEQVKKLYGERITIDREVDNRPSLEQATLLICDISGIIYDFAFFYQKPVLGLYQDRVETMGYESSDIEAPDSVFELLEDVGAALHVEQLAQLPQLLPQLLAKQISGQVLDKHIFHIENAGQVAAQQILGLYQGSLL